MPTVVLRLATARIQVSFDTENHLRCVIVCPKPEYIFSMNIFMV